MEFSETKLGLRVIYETDNNGPIYHGRIGARDSEWGMVRVRFDGETLSAWQHPTNLQTET